MKLNIGNETFNVKIASTDASRRRGLSGIEEDTLPDDSGLVLKYDAPKNVTITMNGMKFPLDLVFINEGKVVAIKKARIGSKDIDIGKPVTSVLEVKLGCKGSVSVGDSVEWVGEKKADGTIIMAEGGLTPEGDLHVLDDTGKVQMNVKGNERVFSRTHTTQLYDLSVDAETPADFRAIGRAMVRMINKQDTQAPQHAKN